MMLVSCKFNTGAAIPPSARCFGENEKTEFSSIKIGCEYQVFSILLVLDNFYYLVCGENERPSWVPCELFYLIDSRIPEGWGLCITSTKKDYQTLDEKLNIGAIFGYKEMIDDYSHYVGLIERDSRDLNLFYREKARVETWWRRVQREEASVTEVDGDY